MNWLDVGTGVRTGTSQVGSHSIPPDRTFPKQPHSRADFQAHWQLRQVPGKLWTQQMSVNHLCEVLFFRSDMLLCPLAWGQQDLSPPPFAATEHTIQAPYVVCKLLVLPVFTGLAVIPERGEWTQHHAGGLASVGQAAKASSSPLPCLAIPRGAFALHLCNGTHLQPLWRTYL